MPNAEATFQIVFLLATDEKGSGTRHDEALLSSLCKSVAPKKRFRIVLRVWFEILYI